MSSRTTILNAISRIGLTEVPLPDVPALATTPGGEAQFEKIITAIGGRYERIDRAGIRERWEAEKARGGVLLHTLPVNWGIAPALPLTVTDLEAARQVWVEGTVGVAENGAIWVTEGAMIHRAAPFLCQELVIILAATAIVPTLHEAYDRIDRQTGFGVFIAGPSRTADIEQSLVIGAHGPVQLQVYVVA